MPNSKKSIASEIAEAMRKKKKRIIETDPEKLSWKALESGGLDPMEFNDDLAAEFESKLHPRAKKLPPRWMRKDRKDVRKELKGMGPEGKRFLKDKLSDKKYEGKLKPKYKKDLLEELHGMSRKGRGYVKKELGDVDQPDRNFKDWTGEKISNLEEDRESRSSKLKSLKKDLSNKFEKKQSELQKKTLEFKGPDFLKPKDWDDWSEKKKEAGKKMVIGAMGGIGKSIGQGFSDVNAKKYIKKEKGDVQKGYGAYKPEAGDVKELRKKQLLDALAPSSPERAGRRGKERGLRGMMRAQEAGPAKGKGKRFKRGEAMAGMAGSATKERFGPAALDKLKRLGFHKEGGDVLSYGERQRMPKGDFALPGKGGGPKGKQGGSYPIPDASHARNALARISQFGNPAQKRKVRAAIAKKFPSIKVSR